MNRAFMLDFKKYHRMLPLILLLAVAASVGVEKIALTRPVQLNPVPQSDSGVRPVSSRPAWLCKDPAPGGPTDSSPGVAADGEGKVIVVWARKSKRERV